MTSFSAGITSTVWPPKPKARYPEPRTTLAAPAMYRLPADALGEVEDYLSAGGGSDNLGHLVAWWVERRPVRAVRLEGRWIDIGTPEEYERAQREFGDTSG